MTRKVSIYRRWLEPVPLGPDGRPIPKTQWPRRRRHCWVVRWFGTDGKRYQVKAESKEQAERIQAEKTAKFDAAPGARNAPRKVTLAEFIDEFVRLRIGPRGQRLSASSLTGSRIYLQKLAQFIGRSTQLANITPADAVRFVASLRDAAPANRPARKLSPATVNSITRTLKAAFNVAVRQLGYLRENPFASVGQDRVADKALRYATPDEFKSLLEVARKLHEKRRRALEERLSEADATESEQLLKEIGEIDARRLWWQVLIALCYTSGTRLNEAINLTWADVDFNSDNVRIIAKPGIGDLQDWQPKGKDSRIVPVPALTINLLAQLQVVADEGSPYVLVSRARLDAIKAAKAAGTWNENRHAVNNVRRQWLQLCRAAGIAHATIHDLRRSAITNWGRRLPIHVTQELAGHANITTTRRYYLAVTEEDMAAARRAASEVISSTADLEAGTR